ncbi:hypothetical protein LAZ67_2002835, partial [Cordylochernes scorpioides]
MTEDNDMQRMTEAGNEYFADALTNMQPHYEDLVSRLTDSIRGLAIPRVEETLISPFDGSYAANNFIQQLERTSGGPQDDATLQARLRTLLKGEPLSLYNELNLASLPYSQAKQTLIDLYPGKSEVTFTKFLTFKLNNQIQLGEYYRQKITMGLQLGLTNPIIVEALTEGLQASDQRLMRAIAPKTLTEWYSTMNRIKGTNSLPTSSEPLQGVTNTSAFHRDTRTPSRGRNYNTFSPNNTLRYPSGARKPPSPCKYCQGDHWNNECSMNRLPYRQQAYHGQPTTHSFPPEQNVAHNLPVPTPRTKSDKIIALRPYRTSLSDQREIQEQVEKMLEYDIIEPSFSPYSSPVTLVTKKDKTKRFCVDYRRLNEIIVPDVHPLPLIENILDKLANAKIYSRADFSSAYWSIEISPPDRNLLSFITLEGQYNFKRLPYGIKIGPQVYERAVSQILQRNRLGFIAHYFDDFIIFSNSIEEHLDHLQQFFDMCNRENFRLNYNKCDFFKTTIEFLGYTISSGTYTPLVKNLDVINAIKVPTSVKSLQSFLGSINVYNKFIKDHARIRNPLNNLLKKNTPWHWDAKCQHSFDTLKECLTTKPVLHLFKEGLPCQLFCDASLQGIAGVLKQQHPDGTLHPVQYYSRALRPHEKNYTITELECLAVIDSVEKFRIYLAGVRFTIFTDHHALQWLKTLKNPTGRLFRWSLKMSAYEYDIKYIKGKTQYEADLLSRNPLCGFLTTTQIIEKQPQLPPSTLIKTNIDGLHTIKRKGIVKIIVPPSLQHTLINKVHLEYNHPGVSQMIRLISTQYTWCGMTKSIVKYNRSCPTCQLIKKPKGPLYGRLERPPIALQPFDMLSIDTISGFSKYGNSKSYLHVIVDHLSRYTWTFPSKSTNIITYIQCLKKVLQCGRPKRLLSDRAPAFTSPKFRRFLIKNGIQPLLTTANNPQANGLCERLNATLTGKLRLLNLENPGTSWTKLIKIVTNKYNDTPHTITGFPPVFLMYNIIPSDLNNHLNPYPSIIESRKLAIQRTNDRHDKEKLKYDNKHKNPHFDTGDLVLVKAYHHPNSGKLVPYFTGPYKITEIISDNVVRINRPNRITGNDSDTVHVNKLQYYNEEVLYISPPKLESVKINRIINPFRHLDPNLFSPVEKSLLGHHSLHVIPPTKPSSPGTHSVSQWGLSHPSIRVGRGPLPSSVVYLFLLKLPPRPASVSCCPSAENPITHTTTTAPSTFHIGFTTETVKVDRMTEDNDMQRMTEAGNEYFADALTNMQPHYEDLVSRLTDSIRGLAIPRVEETLISPFDGSYAANNFIQQLERTSGGPQDDATLQARLRTLLKGEPLSLYNELNLASLPYSQAKQTLIDLYPGKSEVTFTKFLTFKLNNQIQLGEYYRQKITMGLQLGLTNPIIVEALTEGLQASDQRLMRAIAPKTLTEWYSTMNRIKGTNSLPTSSEPLQGVTNTSAFHRDTRTPSRGRNYNTFSPNNTLRYPSGARKPPSPCKYCQGDHWNNECSMNRLPYRQQAYHGQPTTHSFPPEQNVAHNLPVPTPRTKSDKIIALRPYRTSLSDQREIQEQVEKMLEYDIIEPSFSPYSSPVTLVTKKDKTKRFCVDYRRLNEIIVPDVHPLPLIENILDKLANAKIYSRADFSSAYWSIEISPPDRNLLSFITLEGQYNFKRLPYGIKIGPQVYERAVSQILQRNRLGFIAHYFDDFIIFSNSIEEHLDHLQQFFDMCNRENFRLNYNKCDFFKTTIEFLGYTISSGTYTPLVKNLDVINAIKVPTSVKSLQSFLGSINVYNKFIKDHARIRNPLNNLLKKNTPWHWDAKCQHSFDTLKECLTTKPVLHLFKEGLPCQLFCDASLQGIAGVLKQQHPDGTLHPVQYYSRALRPHEKNYTITELECLAVIDSVEKFRIYLAGVRFTIFTDHHALQWLKTLKNPTGRLFRWSLKMSAYEYDIKYIKGKTQYEADLLSRNPLCGFLTTTQIIEKQPQLPPSTLIKTNIDGLHTIKRKGIVKIIVPPSLQHTLINKVHLEYNHPGVSQMIRLISTQYTWCGMTKSIVKYNRSCPTCQLIKKPKGPLYGRLERPPIALQPFDMLSIDTISGFSKYGNSKSYLHVIVDHLSRYTWTFPSKSTNIITYIQCLKKVLQCGRPKRLLSDRAPAFTSPKFRRFLIKNGIQPLLTTANNPQANGLCERLNATLTGKLRLLNLENPGTSWTKLIKIVTNKYNDTPHTITGFPPVFLMYNIIPSDLNNHLNPYPSIIESRKLAIQRTNDRHDKEKLKYDNKHKNPHFDTGDLVLVKAYHHPNSGKLVPYFTGPYKITEIISDNVVRINRPNRITGNDSDTVHVNKLQYYNEEVLYISPPKLESVKINRIINPFRHLDPNLFSPVEK